MFLVGDTPVSQPRSAARPDSKLLMVCRPQQVCDPVPATPGCFSLPTESYQWGESEQASSCHHLPFPTSLQFISTCSCVWLLPAHTLRGAETPSLTDTPTSWRDQQLQKEDQSFARSHNFWTWWYTFSPTCESQISLVFSFCSAVWKGVLQNLLCYKYRGMLFIKLAIHPLYTVRES